MVIECAAAGKPELGGDFIKRDRKGLLSSTNPNVEIHCGKSSSGSGSLFAEVYRQTKTPSSSTKLSMASSSGLFLPVFW